MTYTFDPDALTGALVLELRTHHKLSRAEFSARAGFTGRSTARLSNIENKDSWKSGDREAVARVLTELQGGQFDPRYHERNGDAPVTPAPALTPSNVVTVLPDVGLDDDEGDELVDVAPPPLVIPTVELLPDPPTRLDDGVYRFSNGEQQTWKRCRRKWWFAWYRELRLRTEDFVDARAVGNRVHRALAAWYVPEGQVRVDPRDALERVVVDDWTRVNRLATERQLSSEQHANLAAEFAASTNLERAMVEGYVQWLEETGADSELRVTASETPLAAEVEVVVGGVERPLRLIGLVDTRVHRVTDDARLFLDHKTVGDVKSVVPTLPQNEQMLHYDLLEWLNAGDADVRCDGALYNMLRRVKRSTRAKPPFYDRVEVRHNAYELASYKRRLLAAARNVLATVDALERGVDPLDVVYPSPTSNCRWDCDFFAICNLLDDGSRGVEDMTNALYERLDPRDRYDRTDGRTDSAT